jgi:hypothetical protein
MAADEKTSGTQAVETAATSTQSRPTAAKEDHIPLRACTGKLGTFRADSSAFLRTYPKNIRSVIARRAIFARRSNLFLAAKYEKADCFTRQTAPGSQ